ncbi:hypothetical protein PYW07_001942 [Mythimna separata]|uniref:HECT-type E3 ubiquitin transferase n=1 Tax=Mythimna separata TaxID=271217 RepID=A0AAD7YNM0_MYTSE|nr:hypothetical protein PYW07_001942 [Mythimna separata]
MWQFEDSEIYSIGMIHPSHSRHSGLSMLSGVSQFSGISTLSGCGSPDQLDRLPELPAAEEKRLRRAAQVLQQRLVLRQWLATHRLQHTYTKLLSLDVSSLEDVYWLEDSTARHVLDPKDFGAWSAARQSLPTGKDALQTLKADLWSAVVKNSKHQDAWTWGGMLVVSVSVCGLVTLAAMTQPSLAPEAKHSLLQYVTGKYLHPPSCKVEWGWTEPQAVGETMCFTVHCYQRNGHPYPICDTDELSVSISHGTRKVTAVIELGSGDPAQANTARVKFTVRTAGVYIVSIMIGLVSISGSPYRKWFTAGRVEARRSRVGRAHHALVWAAGHARHLHIHPRDQYDNPAPLTDQEPPAGFSIKINPLGGEVDEQLSSSATFAYDAVNQRVSMTLCFERAGVYRAQVLYEGVLLHNGEFDCIVLTASDTATVQRNISSKRHNISYEARLLSGKPRRVLCCISPKQLTLKDYILKFIPKRITSFRLCPSTKVSECVVSHCWARHYISYEARLLSGKPRRVLCCISPKQLTLKDYILKFIPKRITSFRLCPSTKVSECVVSHCWARHYISYEARLLSGKPRRVLCCISPKQLTLKDYILKFIPKRITSFRLCPSTKVSECVVSHCWARHYISYEARLLSGKPRRVLCCISPKQLTLKDYILKFIPKRITSFRLCPSTKVSECVVSHCWARHYISYEARLLSGKPRRVLCCISPKQLTLKDYILKFIPKRITSFRLCPSTKVSECVVSHCWARHYISYEARLLSGKPRRVLCCISPKQLTLKDYILKFIPKRITSFRLCPSTKVSECVVSHCWARHYISYEARLLSGKPRRVLCCISPKQLTLKDYILKFIPKRITSFRLCPSTKVSECVVSHCWARHYISYEARLLSGKPRRVLCCISPKQLTLKDYILKFIPKRITSFRLCPSTKLILKPTPAGSGPGGEFTLEDGVQPQLELVSAERDLIAATFTQLLIANCGGEDTFKNKQDFFYSEIRKAHSRHPHEKLAIRVLRSELLRTSLKATRHFTVQDWCKNFDVTFQGEQGVDWGGVRREWFSLLCGQLFDSKFGLFVSFHDSPTGLVHPNPDRPPHLKVSPTCRQHTRALCPPPLAHRPRAPQPRPAAAPQGEPHLPTAHTCSVSSTTRPPASCTPTPTGRRTSSTHVLCVLHHSPTGLVHPNPDRPPHLKVSPTCRQHTRALCPPPLAHRPRAPQPRPAAAPQGEPHLPTAHTCSVSSTTRPPASCTPTPTGRRTSSTHVLCVLHHSPTGLVHPNPDRPPHLKVSPTCRQHTRALCPPPLAHRPRAPQPRPAAAPQGEPHLPTAYTCSVSSTTRPPASCTPTPTGRRTSSTHVLCVLHHSPTGLVHPNPDRPPHLKLKHFELAGKLVGKCLYESALGGSYRQLVRARLTRSFLAQIIGLRVHYKYFEQDDPELYLSKIKYVLETDLDAGDSVPELYFCDDVYDAQGRLVETHDLLPNGSTIRVRNSSKIAYLDALAQWRLAARVRTETDAFLRGLTLLVPDNLLAIFDENELEDAFLRGLTLLVPDNLLAIFDENELEDAFLRGLTLLVPDNLLAIFDENELEDAFLRGLTLLVPDNLLAIFDENELEDAFLRGLTLLVPDNLLAIFDENELEDAFLRGLTLLVPDNLLAIFDENELEDAFLRGLTLLVPDNLLAIFDENELEDAFLRGLTLLVPDNLLAIFDENELEDAFLRGLTLLVPDNLLAIFDENELELLVCGTGEVSVSDWRAHALVSGSGRDWERLLSWFWAALANFSTEERARLLQFTTGCSQLPSGGFQVGHTRAVSGSGRDWERLLSWFWAALANFSTEERARLLQFTTGCSQLPSGGFQVGHTRAVSGSGRDWERLLSWFWAALANFSTEERARLLQFTTGCSQLPSGGFQVGHTRAVSGSGRDWERLLSWFWAALANFSTEERARLLQFTTGCSQLPSGGFQVGHTRAVSGSGRDWERLLSWFWAALANFSTEERARLLQFTTGCSQLPSGGFQVGHTRAVSGSGRDWERLLSWFWAALANFSTEERARLLQFTTGCSQLPSGGFQVGHTRAVSGSGRDWERLLSWFWAALANFSTEERARLLQFTTGCSQLPSGGFQVGHTRAVSGSGRDWERLLSWFWAALANFSTEERARLLQFTTGCSQLPSGGFQVGHTRAVSGSGRDWERLLSWFWAALANFSTEERARLLQFTTGCSQLPSGGFQVGHTRAVSGSGRDWERLLSWFWAALANFSTEERARLLQFTTGCSQLPSGGFQVGHTRAVSGSGRDWERLLSWFWAALANFSTEERARLLQFTTGCSQLPSGGFQVGHTRAVSGSGRDWERLLSWFWAALANFSTEERARLLQFTTGCSQLPSGGFQELNPRFQITAAPNFGALPTAHTCFNQLCLPDYDSYEQLVHALLWAINEGGEGFGMI